MEIPRYRPLTPAEAGALAADRERLLREIFAIEAGLEDGTAPDHWKRLLTYARWMRQHEPQEARDAR